MEKHEEQKEWTAPTVTEFDVAERTLANDGPDLDGVDPEAAAS